MKIIKNPVVGVTPIKLKLKKLATTKSRPSVVTITPSRKSSISDINDQSLPIQLNSEPAAYNTYMAITERNNQSK